MKIRPRRVLIATAIGTAAYFVVSAIHFKAIHRYRVWKADGVWCALENDIEGWQFGYGEECP